MDSKLQRFERWPSVRERACFLSDVGPTLETLDFAFHIRSTPTFLYFIWTLLLVGSAKLLNQENNFSSAPSLAINNDRSIKTTVRCFRDFYYFHFYYLRFCFFWGGGGGKICCFGGLRASVPTELKCMRHM